MRGGEQELKDYKEESYQLEVNKENKVSTRMFTYSEDESKFSGFWFYDNDEHNYAINDRGKIITSNLVDPYLKRGTFVRRIGLNKGEIGETQNDKNDERMVYINKDVLVNKTLLLYDENTLIINDGIYNGHYYVEFSDLEGNETQLIVNSELDGIVYSTNSNYKLDKTGMTGKNFNISYTDNNGNKKVVYAYRSRNIVDEEFKDNNTLLGVHLTTGVGFIGKQAFRNCTGLTQVTISNNVETIYEQAFRNCTGLTQVTIPNSVTTINSYAFQNCTNLKQVTIPNSVTTINSYVFQNCTNLTQVTIQNDVEIISNGAFQNCTKLTKVTIPNSVTTINSYAFQNCTELTQITIPNSVTSIGSYAFQNCTELTQVTIPNSVTTIGENAFNGCDKINTIIITNYNNVVNDNNDNNINDKIESVLDISDYTQSGVIDNTITYTKKKPLSQ